MDKISHYNIFSCKIDQEDELPRYTIFKDGTNSPTGKFEIHIKSKSRPQNCIEMFN